MPNRLADATSPYLLQHKDNPVDWWEWGDEAFKEARLRDVPVLLSVGYAACHWCHVMAHESFEDPATASLMNDRFVNVKVDREERPDVDSVYMEAVQAMSGHGGWPMTVFIDHEGRPFFAGTYFPDQPRHGMASLRQVIEAVSHAWQQRRSEVTEQAERLVEAISGQALAGTAPTVETLAGAYRRIEATFDSVHGGFGSAPKFPQQPVIDFLLRVHREEWADDARRMLVTTLEKMAAGGIHDHLGGGFSRYSVDEHWLVPHFEKMLYDNAQLARLYLWGGVELSEAAFLDVARSTLGYLARDLRHPEGGFYSSEDADSEGVEGKFYVWSVEEVEEILGEQAPEVIEYFGLIDSGNFEGANILSIVGDKSPPNLEDARRKLLDIRSERVRPGLDDKVVASWNGLAIRAFAEAGSVLDDPSVIDVAIQAAEFVMGNLMVEGRLMRSWREGRVSVPGFLDDHASLAGGLFTLFAATGELRWYEHALDLVGQLGRFARPDGGFFTTGEEAGVLAKRPTDFTDNPLPSGNALAAEALLTASLLTGDSGWRDQAEAALSSVALLMDRYPTMVAHHLSVAHSLSRSKELAIVGSDWPRLARVYWERYRPEVVLAASSAGTTIVPLLAGRTVEDGALAYVCKDFVCDLPTSDTDRLARQLI